MNSQQQILIVEDDVNDAFFIRRAFKQSGINREPHVCPTVADAIKYLEGSGEYADRTRFPFPNLVVSDIKMPGQSGFDFLRWIRDHPQFEVIPTVIMSSSHRPQDVKYAYCLGASAYMCKPSSVGDFDQMFHRLLQFWEICEIPENEAPSCEELNAGLSPGTMP